MLTYSNIWTISFFFLATYLTFFISLITYLLPIISTKGNGNCVSIARTNFSSINAGDLIPLIITPYIILLQLNLCWIAPATSAWFGHLIIAGFQMKAIFLLTFFFLLTLIVFVTANHFSSREAYDYLNTTYSIFYWVMLLFTANSLFTVIFIFEVLSATLFMLIITSTFSSTLVYNNLDLSSGHLFQQSTPHTYLQAILSYFWISLISALSLFLCCILIYQKVLTFDWSVLEYSFTYWTNSALSRDTYALGIGWLLFLFCIFLKCGLAPLYIWKPTLFKGIPLHTLFFYVSFYYFFIFVFIIHLLSSYFSEMFYFYSLAITSLTLLGLTSLLFIICESFYIKVFLAMSSILNSLFVLLALSVPHTFDVFLWL